MIFGEAVTVWHLEPLCVDWAGLYLFDFVVFFVVILVLFFDVDVVFFSIITGFFLFLQFAAKSTNIFFH